MGGLKLVRMDRHRSREVVEVLNALIVKAQAGEIAGIAMCYQEAATGEEESVIAGSYARSRDSAAAATLRLSMKLATARREYDKSP